jgi:plasmid stability protein
MTDVRRATVYFDAELHRALRLKAASADRSISDLVNDAVRLALGEDAEDLVAFAERANEPELDFEGFVTSMRARGRL